MDIALRSGFGPGAVDALVEQANLSPQPLHFRTGVSTLAGEGGLRLFQKFQDALFDFAEFGLGGLHRGSLGFRGQDFSGLTDGFNSVCKLGKLFAQDVGKARVGFAFAALHPIGKFIQTGFKAGESGGRLQNLFAGGGCRALGHFAHAVLHGFQAVAGAALAYLDMLDDIADCGFQGFKSGRLFRLADRRHFCRLQHLPA